MKIDDQGTIQRSRESGFSEQAETEVAKQPLAAGLLGVSSEAPPPASAARLPDEEAMESERATGGMAGQLAAVRADRGEQVALESENAVQGPKNGQSHDAVLADFLARNPLEDFGPLEDPELDDDAIVARARALLPNPVRFAPGGPAGDPAAGDLAAGDLASANASGGPAVSAPAAEAPTCTHQFRENALKALFGLGSPAECKEMTEKYAASEYAYAQLKVGDFAELVMAHKLKADADPALSAKQKTAALKAVEATAKDYVTLILQYGFGDKSPFGAYYPINKKPYDQAAALYKKLLDLTGSKTTEGRTALFNAVLKGVVHDYVKTLFETALSSNIATAPDLFFEEMLDKAAKQAAHKVQVSLDLHCHDHGASLRGMAAMLELATTMAELVRKPERNAPATTVAAAATNPAAAATPQPLADPAAPAAFGVPGPPGPPGPPIAAPRRGQITEAEPVPDAEAETADEGSIDIDLGSIDLEGDREGEDVVDGRRPASPDPRTPSPGIPETLNIAEPTEDETGFEPALKAVTLQVDRDQAETEAETPPADTPATIADLIARFNQNKGEAPMPLNGKMYARKYLDEFGPPPTRVLTTWNRSFEDRRTGKPLPDLKYFYPDANAERTPEH